MNARFAIAMAAALATPLALAPLTARAQYSNEFTPAKLIKQGTTTKSVAGSGTVVVQVQVNADGSHKVTKVIHSSNSGDNAAAMEIAQNSSYRPAHRGSTPITAFYDFTLKFNGKIVATTPSEGGELPSRGASAAANQVAALIRQGQYQAAVSKAQSELISAPGDQSLRQMLGIAAYRAGDYQTAAAAFDRVATIGAEFKPIAADSLATAAVKIASTDPTQAQAYAQKALTIESGPDQHFALGIVQLDTGQNAAALESLKTAHDESMSNSKIPTASKVNIDAELLQAYLANKDMAGAQAIAAEIKRLDPNSNAGARAMGTNLIKAGQAAVEAKDTTTALNYFNQAAAQGDPDLAVTANTQAALAIAQSAKPDYKQMQTYAEKALAVKPDDPIANFADGIALTAQWTASHDDATKKKAADALNKADQEAKAQGNESLSLQIETFVKKNLNAAGSGGGS